jgi:hypothetical protein
MSSCETPSMTDNPAAQRYLRLIALEDTRFTGIEDAAAITTLPIHGM